jgi:integrase/recombinase XerD
MPKQARALNDARLKQAVTAARNERERAMLLLSLKAGLRAVEIAGLEWGRIDAEARMLLLTTTKGDKPRHVPMAKDLFDAITAYRATRTGKDGKTDRVFVNGHHARGEALTPNSVAAWFRDFYKRRLGWEGYSSHSGRRAFATNVARKIVEAKGSLRDVQALLGHESLNSTQRYIETDENAQRKVVDLI